MPSKTITVTNGDGSTRTITIPDRSRFAGVRNISRAVTLPLTDDTTSIQVTVPNKPEFNGVYNATAPVTANSTWTKVGGGVTIFACNYNGTDAYDYAIGDSETWGCFDGVSGTDRPWKVPTALWTITGIAGTETITVNRTAPVITSDRKGESRPLLSKLVGGAAAAYSLRDLNDKAGNNKVVRVRRASDNNERDFLAKEVSNGTLQNWVNTQVTAPLDIREIADSNSDGNNDGRVGNYLIAKAAYSLRSLGTRQATLAATGDTVARANGKFVVQVRRSSDDALKSFTADEVTDGTLLAFVTEAQVGWNIQATFNDSTATITSASSTATTSTVSFTGSGETRVLPKSNYVLAGAGDQVVFNMSVSGLDGSMTFRLRKAGTNTSVGSAVVNNGDNQDITINLNDSGGYPHFTADAGSGEATVTINSIKVLPKTGFVKTWYDQSVTNEAGDTATGNHAVQATATSQPKIVNAGALVADNGIDFDGTSQGLEMPEGDIFSDLNSCSSFVIAKSDITSSTDIALTLSDSGNDKRWYAPIIIGGKLNFGYGSSASAIEYSNADTNKHLFTAIAGSSTAEAFLDGTSKGTVSSVSGQDSVSGINLGGANDALFWDGTIQEIVVYNTDQTANRTAIEANIGEAYSITGIPAYDNTVDGFVETWYDQSGNGSDATQLTAGSQPKIVDAGSLVTGGIDFLDGTETFLETTNSDICNVPQLSLFTVLTPHIASSQLAAFSCGATVNSTSYGGWEMNLNGYSDHASFQTQSKGNSLVTGVNTSVTSSEALLSFVSTFPNASISRDGGTVTTSSSMVSPNQTTTGTRRFRIGCKFTFRAANFYTQPIKEIIIYTSDQTANRPAIEANINNQYDIY